jgi:hypothetical protein
MLILNYFLLTLIVSKILRLLTHYFLYALIVENFESSVATHGHVLVSKNKKGKPTQTLSPLALLAYPHLGEYMAPLATPHSSELFLAAPHLPNTTPPLPPSLQHRGDKVRARVLYPAIYISTEETRCGPWRPLHLRRRRRPRRLGAGPRVPILALCQVPRGVPTGSSLVASSHSALMLSSSSTCVSSAASFPSVPLVLSICSIPSATSRYNHDRYRRKQAQWERWGRRVQPAGTRPRHFPFYRQRIPWSIDVGTAPCAVVSFSTAIDVGSWGGRQQFSKPLVEMTHLHAWALCYSESPLIRGVCRTAYYNDTRNYSNETHLWQ